MTGDRNLSTYIATKKDFIVLLVDYSHDHDRIRSWMRLIVQSFPGIAIEVSAIVYAYHGREGRTQWDMGLCRCYQPREEAWNRRASSQPITSRRVIRRLRRTERQLE